MGGQGQCDGCGEVTWLLPLHGEKGGPLRCFKCAGAWNAEHGRRRRAGRAVIKALKVFFDAGGAYSDVDKLKLAASGISVSAAYDAADTLGTEVGDITSELLADVIGLCHPDKHPEERRELTTRVTQELLALKPFVFPAPKSKETPAVKANDGCSKTPPSVSDKPSQPAEPAYPCEDCADAVPYFYCNACKARHEQEQVKEREVEDRRRQEKNAKQHQHYKQRKQARAYRAKPQPCENCGEELKSKRADARYCCASCRQAAYLKRDGNASNHKPVGHQQIETTIDNVFAGNPHGAFTVDDLCDHAFPGERIRRKHRVAVVAAAKKVSQQTGEHRDWWRSDARGRALVFWNRASVTSYAMARMKGYWIEAYRGDQKRRASKEVKLKEKILPGGRYYECVVRGGTWWKDCQEDVAKFKHVTANQNDASVDLTSRHSATA